MVLGLSTGGHGGCRRRQDYCGHRDYHARGLLARGGGLCWEYALEVIIEMIVLPCIHDIL
jgi:hypothetical protein